MIIDIYVNSLLPVESSKPEYPSGSAALLLACFAAICKATPYLLRHAIYQRSLATLYGDSSSNVVGSPLLVTAKSCGVSGGSFSSSGGLYLTTLSVSKLYNVRFNVTDKRWIGKDLEGSDRDLIQCSATYFQLRDTQICQRYMTVHHRISPHEKPNMKPYIAINVCICI
jgi:hypothetical protein